METEGLIDCESSNDRRPVNGRMLFEIVRGQEGKVGLS